jgi:hypothetical protein
MSHSATQTFPWIIDMVHHNPGEAPFDTAFTNPGELKQRGYNAQCFKHINTVLRLEDVDAPAPSAEEFAWLETFTQARQEEIAAAKAAGLAVFYHIDLIVLPKRVVEAQRDALCDENGKISFAREATRALHRRLFDELFTRFPEIDGLIPRVGETYLFDTPFHTGNGAVLYRGESVREEEIEGFQQLLQFLREEICERHGRWLIHRTWDTWPNRFHASADFYQSVVDAVAPHPRLLFSIKHTQVDFHRYTAWNPCLGLGSHPQIVEVQCQREYEGKGAFPNYTTQGVIEGFSECAPTPNLREFSKNPLFQGIYTWSRGGGWHGPYISKHNEFWSDLNLSVLARFVQQPKASEATLFAAFARDKGLSQADADRLHRIAIDSLTAVRQGKCCHAWDTRPGHAQDNYPTNQWMRDDVLGGWDLLEPVFAYLLSSGQAHAALAEKDEAVAHWESIYATACTLDLDEQAPLKELIEGSCLYGLRLFAYIAAAWRCLYTDYARRQGDEREQNTPHLATVDAAWEAYKAIFTQYPMLATPYRRVGWHWPTKPPAPGMGDALEDVRRRRAGLASS